MTAGRYQGAERRSHVPAGIPPFPSHVKTEMVLVTPQDAQRYIDTMHANRSVSRIGVEVMRENLEAGTFYPAISPVYFDDEGCAWDGKHRFEAIVASGQSAWLLFIRGVTAKEAECIDTGRARSYADSLKISNVPEYARRAVLANIMAKHTKFGIDGVRNPSGFPVTRAQLDAWIDAPGVTDAIKAGKALYRATGANPSWSAYAILRTMRPGQEIHPFWEDVRTGANLSSGNPALTLNHWLMQRSRRDRRPADRRLMELYAYATAWNKFVLGQRLASFRPTFERRRDGTLFFPSASVPDFLPEDPGERKAALATMREAFGYVKVRPGNAMRKKDPVNDGLDGEE